MIDKIGNTIVNDKIKSVYSFNDYSIQDLLCKFLEKINKTVDVSNNALDFLNYLKNEGLPEEVIKELNIMYKDGRLTQIIDDMIGNFNLQINNLKDEFVSNFIFDNYKNLIDEKLTQIDTLDILENEIILLASYQNGKYEGKNDFTLYISDNTSKCYEINSEKIIEFITGKGLWDICAFYHNEKFYFIGDYRDEETTWGGNAFLILESEDLKEFKQTSIKIRSTSKNITQTWAPKFFKDGNNVYLIYCIQENNEKYVDTNKTNIEHEKLKMCYSLALNDSLTSWSEPIYFNIPSDECFIDPFMIKKDGVYHLYGCRDNDAKIVHFTSNNINGTWIQKDIVPFPNITEAPSIIYHNSKYYMFVDSHRATGGRDSGFIQVMESNDLNSWTNLKEFKNSSNTTMRHFSPVVLRDNESKNILKKLILGKEKINTNYYRTNENLISAFTKNNISYFDLASITPKASSSIDELYVMPNTIYYMNSEYDRITINKLNVSKLKNFETFSFVLNSFGESILTIKNNSNKGEFLPTRKDLTINGNKGSNLITFTVLDGYIKCHTFMEYVEDKYMFNFVENGNFKREDLTMFSGLNGYTPTLDSSKEYLKIEETSSAQWKGVSQDISLQKNKIYNVSAVIFTKDKSLLTDEVGLTVKGVRTSDSQHIEFASSYLNASNISDYYGKKISFTLDTSNFTLSEYNRFYIYLFLKKQGCIYVKDLRIEYTE